MSPSSGIVKLRTDFRVRPVALMSKGRSVRMNASEAAFSGRSDKYIMQIRLLIEGVNGLTTKVVSSIGGTTEDGTIETPSPFAIKLNKVLYWFVTTLCVRLIPTFPAAASMIRRSPDSTGIEMSGVSIKSRSCNTSFLANE